MAPTSSPVTAIEVREQRALGFARTFQLCMKGIRHRLLRSLLTFAVIVLAVAFFMTLLCEAIFARAVDAGVAAEDRQARRGAMALDDWFAVPGPVATAVRLAAADGDGLERIAAITALPVGRLRAAAEKERAESALLGYFADLDGGSRAMLVGRVRGREILERLADARRFEEFVRTLPNVRAVRFPMPLEQARAVVEQAAAHRREIAAIAAAWDAAVARLHAAAAALTGGAGIDDWAGWLAAADGDRQAAFARMLAANGHAGDGLAARLADLQPALAAMRLRDEVTQALAAQGARERWRRLFLDSPSVEEKLVRLDDQRAVETLEGRWTRAQLASVAAEAAGERRRARVAKALVGKVPEPGRLIGARQSFLVAISFVVCMVGIANAMLMAITERFREIATMKCLGATDGYILTQFLMEAGVQGFFGGVLGMLLGLLIAVIKGGAMYGGHLFAWFPLLATVAAAGACVVIGLLLATLASIYPSWLASRMAPMDAMRVE